MKLSRFTLPAVALVVLATSCAVAQQTQFFRILSTAPTTFTQFTADGYATWTHPDSFLTCTIQASTDVASGSWKDYAHVWVAGSATTGRLADPRTSPTMAFIPAGFFYMGDLLSDSFTSEETPIHSVFVSAFCMDRNLVTPVLWDEVQTWAVAHGYGFEGYIWGKATNHPSLTMTWYEALKWCNARSEKEGKTPAYYTDPGLTIPYRTGEAEPYVNWAAGYRLPTEAEWEKAARGGAIDHRFPWSDSDDITHSRANYNSSPLPYDVSPTRGFHPTFDYGDYPKTSPVGFFAPNDYGLHDMAGNARVWCWDRYAGYSDVHQVDPRGPATGTNRVIRGGSWFDSAYALRVSYRSPALPGTRGNDLGMRTVLPSAP